MFKKDYKIIMGKSLILVFLLFVRVSLCSAQSVTMRDMFIQMPDSLLPYLSHNNKLDLVDFIESGMESEVTNTFDDRTNLLKLTSDYLHLQSSDASSVEMKLLPTDGLAPDSAKYIICVVSTFGEVYMASTVKLYTPQWIPIGIMNFVPSDYEDRLTERPDTMSQERFMVLRQSLYPLMLVASLSENDRTLTLRACPQPLPSDNDNNMDINLILRQITLKWNGINFKEN